MGINVASKKLITPTPSGALASRDQKIPDQPVTRSSRSSKVSHDCVQRLAHEKLHERGKNRDFDFGRKYRPGQKSYKMLSSRWNYIYYSITWSPISLPRYVVVLVRARFCVTFLLRLQHYPNIQGDRETIEIILTLKIKPINHYYFYRVNFQFKK